MLPPCVRRRTQQVQSHDGLEFCGVVAGVEEDALPSEAARALAEFLVAYVQRMEDGDRRRGGMLITSVNGVGVVEHPLAKYLLNAGFQAAPLGFNVRRNLPALPGRTSAHNARAGSH